MRSPNENFASPVHALERRCRRMTRLIAGLFILWFVTVAGFAVLVTRPPGGLRIPDDGILRVRGLSVVDGNGVERVRVGAPLPEPLDLGKRFPRGSEIGGILLFDAEGNERSGYVTSDDYPNVFFTLDSIGRQQVLFLADPGGTPFLRLWNGDSAVQMSVDEDGPELKLTQGREVFFEAAPRATGPQAKPGEGR